MVSYIGTSISCPSPVRARWNSAAFTAATTASAVVLSATIVGTKRGSPPPRADSPASPAAAWIESSYAGRSRYGPDRP
jgi:hypothetical protein